MGFNASSSRVAYNSIFNLTIGLTSYVIVYTKSPNHTTYLIYIYHPYREVATTFADTYVKFHHDIKTKIEGSNSKYKKTTDRHRHSQTYLEGDLVMIFLKKEHFPTGTYDMLKQKKLGPFSNFEETRYQCIPP